MDLIALLSAIVALIQALSLGLLAYGAALALGEALHGDKRPAARAPETRAEDGQRIAAPGRGAAARPFGTSGNSAARTRTA